MRAVQEDGRCHRKRARRAGGEHLRSAEPGSGRKSHLGRLRRHVTFPRSRETFDIGIMGSKRAFLVPLGAAVLATLGGAVPTGLLVSTAHAQVARPRDEEDDAPDPLFVTTPVRDDPVLLAHRSHSSHSSHRSHVSGSGGGGGYVAPSPAPAPAPTVRRTTTTMAAGNGLTGSPAQTAAAPAATVPPKSTVTAPAPTAAPTPTATPPPEPAKRRLRRDAASPGLRRKRRDD